MVSSCKKKDSGSSTNRWTIAGKTYNAVFAGYEAPFFSASDGLDSNNNMCSFAFSGLTTPTAGTYKVVGSFSSIYIPGEVVVEAGFKNSDVLYESTDNSKTTLTVTVNAGKISVSLPDTYVQNFDTKDSVLISAQLTQTY
jgi:hypothetical protein